MIQFENITKKYKDAEVLSDISFEVDDGELVSIIGASGCGKTTTLKMINRLIEPTKGKIYIDGEDISTKDVIKLRRNMGYVIQQTGLFPHMTIRENIELIPKVEHYEPERIKERTAELMEMVGLDGKDYLDRYPTELSGGQKQRIGVARAFATDPQIILMDEPFSALDPITRLGIQDELVDLQSKLKKTIVFVTHDMEEAIKISDRICIMNSGHIVQYDTPEQILKHPANEFVAEFIGKKRVWTSPEYIRAKDIMGESPVTCTKNATLFQCMEMMRSYRVDSLMIVDSKNKNMEGILYAAQIHFYEDKSVKAEEIMQRDFLTVAPEDNILDVLRIVNDSGTSTLPVLNQEGILQGLITKSSLVTALSQQYIK